MQIMNASGGGRETQRRRERGRERVLNEEKAEQRELQLKQLPGPQEAVVEDICDQVK